MRHQRLLFHADPFRNTEWIAGSGTPRTEAGQSLLIEDALKLSGAACFLFIREPAATYGFVLEKRFEEFALLALSIEPFTAARRPFLSDLQRILSN